jgi:hypothetical protein
MLMRDTSCSRGIWSNRAVREIDVSSPKPGDQEYGHSFNQTKRSLLGLHYEETVGCGVAVCLTSYSVNAAHADNSSA